MCGASVSAASRGSAKAEKGERTTERALRAIPRRRQERAIVGGKSKGEFLFGRAYARNWAGLEPSLEACGVVFSRVAGS